MLQPVAFPDVEVANLYAGGDRGSKHSPSSSSRSSSSSNSSSSAAQGWAPRALRLLLDAALVSGFLYLLARTNLLGLWSQPLVSLAWNRADAATQRIDQDSPLAPLTDLHLRIYVPELPSRYLHRALDQFMLRPGGPGTTHEQLFAAPLGRRYINASGDSGGPGGDLYNTDQYANDIWWYTQLLASPLRVDRFEDADVAFVPALFARADPGVPDEKPYSMPYWDFLNEYMPYLPNVTAKPHVLGFARVVWPHLHDFRAMPQLEPFLVTALEPFTGRTATLGAVNGRIVVIPYQAHVHYSRGQPQPAFDAEATAASKSLLASSSFRSRKDFRRALAQQCADRPGRCAHHEYEPADPADFLASWRGARSSWYCFQPPGDTPSRRSLYDCLLAGTIPVVFDYTLLDAMPFADLIPWWEMLLTMSKDAVEGRGNDNTSSEQHAEGGAHNATTHAANVVDALARQHNETAALARLRALHGVKHLVQYSVNPVHEMIRYDEAWAHLPADDAFTASWKAIIRRLCAQERLPACKCCSAPQFVAQHPERCQL